MRRYGCDASEPDDVERLFQNVAADLGAPTLVVHNVDGRVAGIFRKGIADADPGMALDTLRNSAFSAFLIGQRAARLMRSNRPDANGAKGTIIFTNASGRGSRSGSVATDVRKLQGAIVQRTILRTLLALTTTLCFAFPSAWAAEAAAKVMYFYCYGPQTPSGAPPPPKVYVSGVSSAVYTEANRDAAKQCVPPVHRRHNTARISSHAANIRVPNSLRRGC